MHIGQLQMNVSWLYILIRPRTLTAAELNTNGRQLKFVCLCLHTYLGLIMKDQCNQAKRTCTHYTSRLLGATGIYC